MSMFLQLKSLSEVQEFLKRWPVAPKGEKVSLKEACERISFSDVHAPFSLPPFDKSLMDGYAVIAKDTFTASEKEPATLKMRESVNAGEVPKYPLRRGWATYVATGAGIPKNADSVVMVEHTQHTNGKIEIMRSASVGDNVLKIGTDFARGDLILQRNTKLTPRHIGLLSSFGFNKVVVYRKPRIAIISSGDEIIEVGKKVEKGRLYDINGPTLKAYVEQAGGHADFLGIARDERKSIKKFFLRAKDYDLTLFSAGASAGNRDLVSSVLEKMGKVHFHGIAIKPGKPTLIAEVNKKLVFGLPGNPTSCLMIFFLLVVPFLARMTGDKIAFTKKKFICADRIFSAKGKRHFIAVKIKDGTLHNIDRGSGAYSTFFNADGFAVIPEDVEYVEAGEKINVVTFGDECDG